MTKEERKIKWAKYMREYYHKNKEKCRGHARKSAEKLGCTWNSNSKEKQLEYSRRQNKKRSTDEQYKSWMRNYNKSYNEKHHKEMNNLVKTTDWASWYAIPENKEKYLESRRKNYNPEKEYARQLDQRTKLRKEVFSKYGGCCKCCGENNIGFLNIDHINEDGAERRRKGEWKGVALYRWIKRNGFPSDMQILCYNCNIAKHIYGECPHVLAAKHVTFDNLLGSEENVKDDVLMSLPVS
jgi:hypothetical protein